MQLSWWITVLLLVAQIEKKSQMHIKTKKYFFIGKNKLVKSNISKISTKTSLKSTELLPD